MGGETCRPKFWKELSIEEKIERMRDIIKGIDTNVQATRKGLSKMEKHSHQDNKLVVPLREDHFGGLIGKVLSAKPDEVYF